MEAKSPQADPHLSELAMDPDNSSLVAFESEVQTRSLSRISWICVFASLISSMFLFALDNTIVANVQPSIIESLGNVDLLPWVSVSYPLGVIALNMLQTNLFMIFDNKPLFITGVVVFEVGSVICGAAPNMRALIVGRFICGLGGCGIYAGAMNLISALTSEAERSMYLGLVGLTWGIGTVLGPVIGGGFAGSSATWRWCFYINLCVGAVVAPVYIFLLPSHLPGAKSGIFPRLQEIDWVGAALNAGAMACLVMGIAFGGGVYAWSSSSIIALFVVSGILWICFVAQQYFAFFTTKDRRLFPVRYLHSREMTILFLQIVFAACVVYIPLYYIPLYFQFARGDTSLQAAVRLLPLVISQVVGVIASGACLNKVGYYFPWYLAGSVLSLIGGVLFYLVRLDTTTAAIYGYSVLVGLGCGLYVQVGYAVAQLLVPAAEIPQTVVFIGYGHITGITLSLTLGGSIFLNEATKAVQSILPDVARAVVQQGITGTSGHFFSTIPSAARLPILSAIVRSISNLYIIVIVASSLSIILSLVMKRHKLEPGHTK